MIRTKRKLQKNGKGYFHEHVKEALEKAGWTITHDPYFLKWKKKNLQIDLGAEKILAAQKGKTVIAVEVKSFLSHSRMSDFHTALGQYRNYFRLLRKTEPERTLYLAIPKDAWSDFFDSPFGKEVIAEEQLKIIVYNPVNKKLVLWIN